MGEDGAQPDGADERNRPEDPPGGYGLAGVVVGLITIVGLCQVVVLVFAR